jgi:hypothetical protein
MKLIYSCPPLLLLPNEQYLYTENHNMCNVTSDVSCIVIGELNHVVCTSHVVQSAVCSCVGGAAEGPERA